MVLNLKFIMQKVAKTPRILSILHPKILPPSSVFYDSLKIPSKRFGPWSTFLFFTSLWALATAFSFGKIPRSEFAKWCDRDWWLSLFLLSMWISLGKKPDMYSWLSNKQPVLIKHTGWKFFPKLISVQALINVQGRNFSLT